LWLIWILIGGQMRMVFLSSKRWSSLFLKSIYLVPVTTLLTALPTTSHAECVTVINSGWYGVTASGVYYCDAQYCPANYPFIAESNATINFDNGTCTTSATCCTDGSSSGGASGSAESRGEAGGDALASAAPMMIGD
jgi:hypothetical protein